MDFGSQTVYTFELWSSNGSAIADISRLCHNRSWSRKRNDTLSLSFDVDLYALEAFAAGLGVSASTLLAPYQMDVKVKRNGVYLFGSQIVSAPFNDGASGNLNQGSLGNGSSTFSPTVTVNCQGYLDLFKDRYVTKTYTGNERCYIAGDLITQAQAASYGNAGVTLNATQYNTGITDTQRTYTRGNVKTNLQNLAALTDAPFDFDIDANKVFTTYQKIGADRTDIALIYGSDQGNVTGLYVENSATNLFNEVIGIGSGVGTDALTSTQTDSTSATNYFLRQNIKQYNSVIEQATLDGDAVADLALEKDLLRFPQVTINGNTLANVPFLSVGDRIALNAPGLSFFDWMSASQWRIEQMDVTLDDNDFEQSIRLYLDNYAV